jgi:3-isopropylmalate/(R)-2-methylmalate dehydratase small subunit
MELFSTHTGIVGPLDRVNIDTDQIMPKQFLKRIERTGYGPFLFYDWRYLEDGKTLNPDFILNQPRYDRASILVTGRNFGSGSSREAAPWGLQQYGFKTIIAPSFADIFRGNCFQNGLLTIVLPENDVENIISKAKNAPGYELTIDLDNQTVSDSDSVDASFKIDAFRKYCLVNGLDDIGLILKLENKIAAYEENRH